MKYTLEPGRHIYQDGVPFISIIRVNMVDLAPTDADTVVRLIVRALNRASKRVCKDCKQTCDLHHFTCPKR